MKEFTEKLIKRLEKDNRIGRKSSEAVVDKVNQIAMMYAQSLYLYGVNITEKWETAVQNCMALERAYLRGRQDERDRLAEYNNGWIPCGGCKDCQHKECEHYGKV